MRGLLLAAFFTVAPLFAAEGSMTAEERAYLVQELESSKKELLSAIQGLTKNQWTFKPSATAWSPQDCAEHLILTEGYLFENAQKILKSPAAPRLASATAESDRALVAKIKDRSGKATAPEALVPSGKFATPQDAAREFTARRDKTIAYVKSSEDALRVHSAQGPIGPMDAYQLLLLMAAHSSRHTAQIREAQANPSYPRTSAVLRD
jgi:hypothetical protein